MSDRPLHVVQVGTDVTLFQEDAPSDTAERHRRYADVLGELRPGSRMTSLVLGAPVAARGRVEGQLHVEPLPGGRLAQPFRLVRALRHLDAAAPIDVVATQTLFEDAWGALFAARRRRFPVVGQVHFDLFADAALGGDALRRTYNWTRHRVARRTTPRLAAVRVVSAGVGAQMRSEGWHHRVAVIPVPSTLVSPSDAPVLEREPLVLYVGRLAPEKGVDTWLAAAAVVRDAVPDARFAVIGGGDLAGMVGDASVDPTWNGRLEVIGSLPPRELAHWYDRSSVLLLTSRHEGFGRVLVEAQAHGCAIVAPGLSSLQEVVTDGVNGRVFPAGDAAAAGAAVIELLRDAAQRELLAARARADVAQRFAPDRLAQEWMSLLIDVAGDR